MENKDQNLLEPVVQLVPASHGKRLANYIIDVIVFSFPMSFVLTLSAPIYPLMHKIMMKQPIDLSDQLVISFFYGLYMSVMEALFKGKSIGKFITRTRAVDLNGFPVTAQTAFLRGLIRIFPFEQLSAISMPCRTWHDRWSNTLVVDEAKSVLPKTD